MPKSKETFDREHKAFRARLQKIHQGPIGQTASRAINDLRKAYYDAALEHWAELGNRASTGWGSIPQGEYQGTRTPEQCADEISRVLAQYFSNDPNDPPGNKTDLY
jgi:hypothetical protein